jgi:cytochrome b6-f complex iron-sulfur subunit
MVGLKRLVEDSREMSRRSFLAITGWGAFTVATLIATWEVLRPGNLLGPPQGNMSGGFLYPNVTYEDPPAFKADPPSSYAVGSTTVLTDKRVVINHDPDGFYVILLICTHLGCTPRYFSDVTSDLVAKGIGGLRATKSNPEVPGFKCPCHGSRYYRDAVNFYGPAPRPMERILVSVARDGRLYIDRSQYVKPNFRLKV